MYLSFSELEITPDWALVYVGRSLALQAKQQNIIIASLFLPQNQLGCSEHRLMGEQKF